MRFLDYAEHALSAGGDASAAAYVECAVSGQVLWGVGVDAQHRHASLKAVVSRGEPRACRWSTGGRVSDVLTDSRL